MASTICHTYIFTKKVNIIPIKSYEYFHNIYEKAIFVIGLDTIESEISIYQVDTIFLPSSLNVTLHLTIQMNQFNIVGYIK